MSTARSRVLRPETWGWPRTVIVRMAFTRGMELRAKYTLFAEGARGNLTKRLLARFGLDEGREPQKFGIGLKELWQVAPRAVIGRVWCSTRSAGRSTILPAAARSSITSMTGSCRSASSCTSTTAIPISRRSRSSSASRLHPLVRGTFEGGKRLAYGARALTEGGYQSVPKLAFPGGALIGCAAGFMNVPRIKGSHNAMLSGMLAAEQVADALQAGRGNDELASYDAAWRTSDIGRDLWKVRNAKPLWSRFGNVAGRSPWPASTCGPTRRLLVARHASPPQAGFGDLAAGGAISTPIVYPKPDGQITFDKLSSVFLSNTNHEEDQPSHLKVADMTLQKSFRARHLSAGRRRAIARPAFTSGWRRGRHAFRDQRAELRALQDLRYQGPEWEHHLGAARGRRRAELPEHVSLCVTIPPISRLQGQWTCPLRAVIAGRAQTGHSRPINAAAPRAARPPDGVHEP